MSEFHLCAGPCDFFDTFHGFFKKIHAIPPISVDNKYQLCDNNILNYVFSATKNTRQETSRSPGIAPAENFFALSAIMRELKLRPCPFGKALIAARALQGITQYKLAKILGRTTQHIAKLEQGKTEPGLSTLFIVLARVIGVDPCDLLRETLKPMPDDAEWLPASAPGDSPCTGRVRME